MTDGFLSRWSRLKTEAKAEPEAAAAPVVDAAPEEPPPPPELPPIDSLTPDSDFSAFLRAGVPEELKKAALAKLWTTDPLFSQPEVFDLHMEDYSFPTLPEVVKTAWNFGKAVAEQVESANFPAPTETLHKITDQDEEPSSGS